MTHYPSLHVGPYVIRLIRMDWDASTGVQTHPWRVSVTIDWLVPNPHRVDEEGEASSWNRRFERESDALVYVATLKEQLAVRIARRAMGQKL